MEAPLLNAISAGISSRMSPRREHDRVASEPHGYTTTFPPLFERPGPRIGSCLVSIGVLLALYLTLCREWLTRHGLTGDVLLTYASIPLVSTVFTYIHIWGALYMTFYPTSYVGCLQIPDTNTGLGWQGIIPNKVEKMARTAVENITKNCLNLQTVVSRIDPAIVKDELNPILHQTFEIIISEAAKQEGPETWEALPEMVKTEIIRRAHEEVGPVIRNITHEMQHNIEELFDIEEMVVRALVRDPDLMNHMFISCGYKELVFIRDCGAYMGGLFGIAQVMLWIYWSAGWMLPTFGFLVGMLSNWIALKMIFEPVEPVPLFGGRVMIQGIFLKRQAEVSAEYSKILTDNLFASRNLISALVSGDRVIDLVHKHVCTAVDQCLGVVKPIARLMKGTERYERYRRSIGDSVIRSLPGTMSHLERYMDDVMEIEKMLRERMAVMSPHDFEQLLHPVFQEDEWKLVLLGGVLGIVVGCVQWHFLGS